ncbi:sigma 54-interacting transcriptional regulator [Clostridiaceae bacterium HSG29]|nr:sigma 54-interacting transcriptional regulator [Clostridiaceae bacterium HSG29]
MLNNYLNEIKVILDSICISNNLEGAIFDKNANLILYSDRYLEKKGKNVHKPFIDYVIENEKILVNKPGEMSLCSECRFKGNCPATIEILDCIRYKNKPIGVISLTSFNKEGHNRIEAHITKYFRILEQTSKLISQTLDSEFTHHLLREKDILINELIEDSEYGIIIADETLNVLNFNKHAENDLSLFCLYNNSLTQVFKNDIITRIKTNDFFTAKTKILNSNFNIECRTVDDMHIIKLIRTNCSLTDKRKNKNEKKNQVSIITNNEKMNILLKKAEKLKESPSNILITGDTGTGKSLFAKHIHSISNRKYGPFVELNCANIPDSLIESELFGYKYGAFTGANKSGKIGLFEHASSGTIFLDEISEIPLSTQAKLLRAVQEKRIYKLGSTEEIPVDVRIICATNKNLKEMIKNSTFRSDLYYRIKVISFNIPSLSKRTEDIEKLCYHFIDRYNKLLNKDISLISNDTIKYFNSYNWPGNIRELENAIECAVNLEDSSTLTLESIPDEIKENFNSNEEVSSEEKELITLLNDYGTSVDAKKKIAKILDISLRTLYRKIEKYNL